MRPTAKARDATQATESTGSGQQMMGKHARMVAILATIAILVAFALAGCSGTGASASTSTPTSTPTGAILAQYSGVCGMTTTRGVYVPAGAMIQWSEHPTSSNNQFTLQALYVSGTEQTVANTPLGSGSAQSGSVEVSQDDTVSFLTNGWGCNWTVTVYAGANSGSAATLPSTAIPTTPASSSVGPSEPPVTPTLADSYVLIGNTMAAYIDLKDGIAAVTDVQQSSTTPGLCVVSRTEQDMTYTQSGTLLYITASYIASTPFTINPDGSIQHEVPHPDGTVVTQRFVPGTNADYNVAVQRFTAQYPSC